MFLSDKIIFTCYTIFYNIFVLWCLFVVPCKYMLKFEYVMILLINIGLYNKFNGPMVVLSHCIEGSKILRGFFLRRILNFFSDCYKILL
jgi:hypothetical protein